LRLDDFEDQETQALAFQRVSEYPDSGKMSTWRLERTADGVWVQGEIDLAKAVKFADGVNAAIADAASDRFALDLSGVTFIDSTGAYALTTLVNAHPSLDFVIRTSPAVFRVLELIGVTDGAWRNVEVLPPPVDEPA
jgi:anti-anti-sigma factor